jgi:hypothetical protein
MEVFMTKLDDVYATESVDLTTGDYVPSDINVRQIRGGSAGDVLVHFIGDPVAQTAKVVFTASRDLAQNMNIDKIIKVGTTVPDTDILLLGMPKVIGLQKIFGNIYREGINPAVGAKVVANVESYFYRISDRLISQQVTSTLTSVTGYFELYLAHGTRALITAINNEEIYLSKWVTVNPSLECNIDFY